LVKIDLGCSGRDVLADRYAASMSAIFLRFSFAELISGFLSGFMR
jgi:hypothetical protein